MRQRLKIGRRRLASHPNTPERTTPRILEGDCRLSQARGPHRHALGKGTRPARSSDPRQTLGCVRTVLGGGSLAEGRVRVQRRPLGGSTAVRASGKVGKTGPLGDTGGHHVYVGDRGGASRTWARQQERTIFQRFALSQRTRATEASTISNPVSTASIIGRNSEAARGLRAALPDRDPRSIRPRADGPPPKSTGLPRTLACARSGLRSPPWPARMAWSRDAARRRRPALPPPAYRGSPVSPGLRRHSLRSRPHPAGDPSTYRLRALLASRPEPRMHRTRAYWRSSDSRAASARLSATNSSGRFTPSGIYLRRRALARRSPCSLVSTTNAPSSVTATHSSVEGSTPSFLLHQAGSITRP